MADARDARLNLRTTAQQRFLIERAAAAKQETLTDYVVRHSVEGDERG